jgi:acyl carrier protein
VIPFVEEAFTFVVDDISASTDKKRLVAYVQKSKTSNMTAIEIRNKLSELLPSYMLPSHFVFIEQLPLLPNGKVDRKKLISTYIEHDSIRLNKHIAGRNEVENNLIYSWAKILNINPRQVSAKDSFTTLDGDSLSFIQASLVLEREIGKIPEGWQSLSIEKLAEISYQEQKKLDFHTEVLFRAIAIILVVIGHFWMGNTNKQIEELFINATSALLLIAGFTFANFPMKSIQYKNNISPILKTIIRIAVPTFLVTLVHVIYRSDYSISKLLFFDNFHWAQSPYWFIEVLLQTLLLVAIIFSFKRIRAFAIKTPYHFGLISLFIFALAGMIIPYFWSPNDLNPMQLPHMKSWLFFFGWCIFYIQDNQQKLTMAALGVILPIMILGQISVLTSLCTLLLIYMPKINIPKTKLTSVLHMVIYAVASASLYIYITHMQFRAVLHAIGFDQFILIDVAVGLAGGVLVHYIWHSLIASTARKVVSHIKNKVNLISTKLVGRRLS